MRRRLLHFVLVSLSLWLLVACGGARGPAGPAPLEAPPTTPSPVAEVIFRLAVAAASPPGTAISLQLIDEVSGPDDNIIDIPLGLQPDGTWTAKLTPPVDSVLRYRYRRTAPSPSQEFSASGEPARDRLAVISGSQTVSDVLAAWADETYIGVPGRIVGTITEAGTNAPLPDILVTAGGAAAFTDGQGGFRLDGLPPGLHTLGVLSPTGSHRPVQQGAIVASDSATPAALSLEPALSLRVSFEVTVPSDTPPGSVVRLIGNTRILGDTFSLLPGGQSVDVTQALPLVMVDSTHYLALATMYAGTDLRYKYTLGDGYWNAERDEQGALRTRQLLLPGQDLVIADVVSTWHSDSGASIPFFVTAPPGSPAGEGVSLEFAGPGWTTPLPMWPLGDGRWTFTLHGPTSANPGLRYRYCRNQQCGQADDVDTSGAQAEGRTLNPSSPPTDVLTAWAWWDPAAGGATVVAPEIVARPEFEAGYEVLAPFHPSWSAHLPAAMAEMAAGGANAVVLTPSWTLGRVSPTPRMAFDPASSPFLSDLARQAEQARNLGLSVSLHPRLIALDGDEAAWWAASPRDGAWWSVWFEQYRAFALTYAALAEKVGATKLVLGGQEVIPALPAGMLANGSPSGAPADAESRWKALLAEIRTVFSGRLAWEVDLGTTLQGVPWFSGDVQEIHIAWHAPLTAGPEVKVEEMQAEANKLLDATLGEDWINGRPVYLSLEYLSVNGGATGCAPAPDGRCRPPSDFDSGAIVDPDLAVDLAGQSAAINAVLLAAYPREAVFGVYVRGFHPAVALQDKSASVRGKPAQQMLGYWFPRLTGK